VCYDGVRPEHARAGIDRPARDFEEIAQEVTVVGRIDTAKLKEIMLRHVLVPAEPWREDATSAWSRLMPGPERVLSDRSLGSGGGSLLRPLLALA
jgi:hypothetical protein